jgi:hypothetical protein
MSGNKDSSGTAKDLLFRDYDYLQECFWKNEQSGETRVNLFIGLLTLVGGALVTLSTTEGLEGESLRMVFVLSLGSLLVLGLITLFRILKRNKYTDEIKKGLDEIRKRYKKIYDEDEELKGYDPIIRLGPKKGSKIRKIGGLAHTMAAINGIMFSGFIGALVYPPEIEKSSEQDIILLIGLLLFLFILSFAGQCFFIHAKEKEISK